MQQVSIFFTLLEGHKTLTRYGLSVAFKLTLVKFVNIGIIPLIVNQKFSTYFTEFGLTEDAFANITFWIAGEVIFVFLEPAHFIKIFR